MLRAGTTRSTCTASSGSRRTARERSSAASRPRRAASCCATRSRCGAGRRSRTSRRRAFAGPAAARLDELRLVALERRIDAELRCGRARRARRPSWRRSSAEHPLRERPRALLMLALYRCGRQADALAAYRRRARRSSTSSGIEPGAALQELERAILRQDPSLEPSRARREPPAPGAPHGPRRGARARALPTRSLALAEPLAGGGAARDRARARPWRTQTSSARVGAGCDERRRGARGARRRSRGPPRSRRVTPGRRPRRLAAEQDADLAARRRARRRCSRTRGCSRSWTTRRATSRVLVGGERRAGPVVVPFTGAEHDWAAVELGAWLARAARAAPPRRRRDRPSGGRDASRLLAQRVARRAADARRRRRAAAGRARRRRAGRGRRADAGARRRRAHRPLAARGRRPRAHGARRVAAPSDAARPARPPPRRPRAARRARPASPGRSRPRG